MKVFANAYFEVLRQPFGEYQTNCYLAFDKCDSTALIIDPGIGASAWVITMLNNAKATPLAILNTHGHFDHVWSNAELMQHFAKIPLLCPYEDAFMLSDDCFETGLPNSTPTLLVGAKDGDKICKRTSSTHNLERQNSFKFENFEVTFTCYPGHTPGCSVITLTHLQIPQKVESQNTDQVENLDCVMFSGDFIFHRSIGRSDFPYSSNAAMKESLQAFLKRKDNCLVLPGHGNSTSIAKEQKHIPYWLERI